MAPSKLRWLRRGAIGVAVLLVAGFAVGALAGRNADERTATKAPVVAEQGPSQANLYGVTQEGVSAPASRAVTDASGTGGSAGATGAGTTADALGALPLPAPADNVIKTADLAIEVAKGRIDRSWERVFAIASRLGGFVVSSNQGGPTPVAESREDDPRVAEIVIRVPATRFDQALADLSGADIGKVTRRGTSGQDVTQEFVDLESRLRHYRAQESVLLRIMSRARTIGDTISVQQQLSQVQLQIEEITGRLRYLKDQTSFATISVHLAETGAVAGGPSDGPSFTKAWDTAVEGLERIGTGLLIGATWLSPFALLAVVWLATRRWRARPSEA